MARTDFRACVSNSTFVFRVQCSDQNLQLQLNCVRMVTVILIRQLKVVHMHAKCSRSLCEHMHEFLVWAYQK
jgi:hypothetical protein